MRLALLSLIAAVLVACSEPRTAPAADGTVPDSQAPDGAVPDAAPDAASPDGGSAGDASVADAAVPEGGLSAWLDRETYEAMFPQHHALYSYDALVAAAAFYPEFLTEGTTEHRKRELAAFLANIAHETTGGWDAAPGGRYAWGLYFTQEVGCETGLCTGYCDPTNSAYPCAAGKTYHGRGPIQLSWNYNYGAAGQAIGLDLLSDPDAITRDGALAFRTAIWFWMTPQAPKPSCHDVMTGQFMPSASDLAKGRYPGFGLTIDIINGGIECGYARSASVTDRLGFHARFTDMLGVTPGDHLDCDAMEPY